MLDLYPYNVYIYHKKIQLWGNFMNEEILSQEKKCCCSQKKKERSPEEYKALVNRLSRIEGQIRGIKKMLENNTYCPDILIQVSAVNAALNSVSKMILSTHIHTCVVDDIKAGNEEVVDELCNLLPKLMK